MHVAASDHSEIRLTLETAVELVNALLDGDADLRAILVAADFSRADTASKTAVSRLGSRLAKLLPLFTELPIVETETATTAVSAELVELPIAPSIVDHDGAGPHLHWTPENAAFDDQVLADILMALAQELCDDGTDRFGRCAADDCARLFYDNTRNRSKRFCNDPRCASRTHTAQHRARKKGE